MKKILIPIVIIIAISGGYFAFRAPANPAPAGSSAREIVIGGAFGLSGNCAEWGEGEKNAAQMAIGELNAAGGIAGVPIRLIVEDTQCDNKGTVNAVQKLVNADHVRAVVGPTWGDAYQGASDIFRREKVVSISPDTAMEALEFQNQPVEYLFSTYPPQRTEIAALQGHIASLEKRRIAMVWDQDSYSTMMMRLFKEAAPAHNIVIAGEYEMPTGAQDFRTILAKIKVDKPHAIFISFLAAHTKASFLKQAKELGIASLVLSSADIQDESVLASFGKFMDGVIYTYPKAFAGQAAFKEAYRAKYSADPQGPAAANAYDAVRMIAEALRQGARTGAEIQTSLLGMKIPGTFTSELSFNEKHQVHGGEFEVKTVRNGAFAPF